MFYCLGCGAQIESEPGNRWLVGVLSMQFSATERQILVDIMRWRRDVRHFKRDLVSDDLIIKLRQAVQLAPSVGNSRPWRIFMVQSPEMRVAVYENFRQSSQKAAKIYDGDRLTQYEKLKLEAIQTAPVQLAIFTDTDPLQGHGLGRQTLAATLEQSTAMAVQNLCLVARSYGLGVGMVSILDPGAMKKTFAVPENWSFSFYLCIGWPEFESDKPLLHELGWQENIEQNWIDI